jgi:acyl-coenzyme A synthetase/AMP-(fatty) acid ligase
MGDVGYLDEKDRFWFCGRKSHRVQMRDRTLHTEPIEAIANTHHDIYRSALVGTGMAPSQNPLLIVEPKTKGVNSSRLISQVETLLASHPESDTVKRVVVYPKKLPTDIRHNSKIFRETLTEWANRKLPGSSD